MNNIMMNVDPIKHAGRILAIHPITCKILATAKEKRSLKYDKSINAFIVAVPALTNQYVILPEVKKEKLINRIAIVLDESGSMSDIKDETIKVFNELIRTIENEAKINNQETTISLYTFNYRPKTQYFNKSVVTVPHPPHEDIVRLDRYNYQPNGSTALFDTVGTSVEEFNKLKDGENVSYLVYVLTDGQENASKLYDSNSIKPLLKKCELNGRFTLVFNLPPGDKRNFCNKYPVFSDNVREWEATSKGIQDVGEVTTSAFSNFYKARASGARSVSNFYADVDLSKVKQTDLNKLEDISKKVKIVEVPKECVIKDFVESKTKRPYVIGQGYYQLVKKELVQPQKSIAIFDKRTKCVYGGKSARTLLGLPERVNTKLNPFDVSHYEVYCQSTSVNRKLGSHSKLLIDLEKTTPSKATWE